jgi:hypothetical protein
MMDGLSLWLGVFSKGDRARPWDLIMRIIGLGEWKWFKMGCFIWRSRGGGVCYPCVVIAPVVCGSLSNEPVI